MRESAEDDLLPTNPRLKLNTGSPPDLMIPVKMHMKILSTITASCVPLWVHLPVEPHSVTPLPEMVRRVLRVAAQLSDYENQVDR